MSYVPKILIVDDDPRMSDSLRILLGSEGYEMQTRHNGREALEAVSKNDFDLVLLDLVLPDMKGMEIMDHINRQEPEIFVIVITGHASSESAIDSLKRGAFDYIRKPFEHEELSKAVKNALKQKALIRERKRAQEALRKSEERYRHIADAITDYIYTVVVRDGQPYKTIHGPACIAVTGYAAKEFEANPYLWIQMVHYEDRKAVEEHAARVLSGVMVEALEHRIIVKDGAERWVRNTPVPQYDSQGRLSSYDGLIRDITDVKRAQKALQTAYDQAIIYAKELNEEIEEHKRAEEEKKRLEARLLQAQKMESIGTLAGGVAHDFNNLLMGIQGYASLMMNDLDETHPHYHWAGRIEDLVRSGAGLTRQLLGFARGGKYDVRPTDINEIVKKSSSMFGRTRKEITIQGKYEQDLWTVEVDRGQIEQVLLNFYVNAWHAMPAGGALYLETSNVSLDESRTKPYDLQPGRYVKISVTDTGTGMDEATQQRIFDPFFTTKQMGRGAGLGLASAYGIIKSHGGIINVSSKKGHGSTFNICLPVVETIVNAKGSAIREEEIKRGSETILLVDDEQTVIDVGKELLGKLGHKVLLAAGGREALDVCEANKDRIDLVILDMIMPEMGGSEVYNRIKEISPDIKVLLSSGYSIDGQATEILKRGCDGFIQKPFTMQKLSGKIRRILDNL
jgi:two-component system cell cycle sensor histidine kinase/response regulator CckA